MATKNSIPPLVQDDVHKPRPYPASQWGDFFLDYKPCTPQQYRSMEGTAEAKKEEVRQIIIDTAKCSDLPQKLELVDMLQRIGVDYHYGKEINELLSDIHDGNIELLDLRTASLQFYLLRKHGYCVSSDVFSKFIDDDGNIGSTDATSLLGLYNAAYLRTHGEKILGVAMSSTKKILKSLLTIWT
uniref:Terpene synthase N-terminal domain-containing protein n=1 Tax=Triticum urartu TaxID=4572 RepID=A0A8R7P8P9_TRIUA